DHRGAGRLANLQGDVFAQHSIQDPLQLRYCPVEIDGGEHHALLAVEYGKLVCQLSGAFCRVEDVSGELLVLGIDGVLEQVCGTDDGGQKVVEVVGNSRREVAQGTNLLRDR